MKRQIGSRTAAEEEAVVNFEEEVVKEEATSTGIKTEEEVKATTTEANHQEEAKVKIETVTSVEKEDTLGNSARPGVRHAEAATRVDTLQRSVEQDLDRRVNHESNKEEEDHQV